MYHFILNPVAGKGRTLSAIQKIKQFLNERGVAYHIHYTQYPRHATEITRELTGEGSKNIIAMGGDGTVNEVLNGIADFESCNMGIIPCGTGNDFAKFINLPFEPVKAMQLILESSPKYTDYIQVNGGKRVMNVTGMGLDVAVLERCNRMKFFKGKLQYLISLIITLLKFKWYRFRMSVDGGEEQDKTAMIVAVCNGKYFGGGMPISPSSSIEDNYLNVIVVNKMKKSRIPMALIGMLRGKLLKYDFVENILCKRVSLKSLDGEDAVNMDGELVRSMDFDCLLMQNQLKMFR